MLEEQFLDDDISENAGALHVWKLSGGSYEKIQTLTDPSGGKYDQLGFSVAISSDSKYIVGGATGDDDISLNAGALVVFELSGGSYEKIQTLTDPSGGNYDQLGSSVAISSDGKYIVGGAIYDDDISLNAGALVVFELSGGSYEKIQTLTDPSGGNYDQLGLSVAISSDGKYIVGGAPLDDDISLNAGALHVWKLSSGSYEKIQTLTDPSGRKDDYLGRSVAISSDGKYIVGGAHDDEFYPIAGALVVFELSCGSYEKIQKLTDPSGEIFNKLGSSVAISSDGKYIVGGAPGDDDISQNAGALVVFENNNMYNLDIYNSAVFHSNALFQNDVRINSCLIVNNNNISDEISALQISMGAVQGDVENLQNALDLFYDSSNKILNQIHIIYESKIVQTIMKL